MAAIAFDKMFPIHIGMEPSLVRKLDSSHRDSFGLQPAVEQWCRENLRGRFVFRFKNAYEKPFIVYFQDEVDRIHFTMRWF